VLLTKNSTILAAILLILASVMRVPIVNDVRLSFQIMFQMAVTVLLAYALWQYADKWLAALLCLLMLSGFFPLVTRDSFLSFQVVFFGAVWYLMIVKFTEDDGVLMDAMCIIALCHIVFQVLQIFKFDPVYVALGDVGDTVRTVGLMSNRNELAALIAFCFPAFLRRGWVWLLPVVALGLFNTHVTGGILAVLVATIVFAFSCKRKWIPYSIIAGCLAGGAISYFYIDTPGFERLAVWEITWRLYSDRWFAGFGLGSFNSIFANPGFVKILKIHYAQAHNDLLQGLFESGIVFGIIVIGYLVNIARRMSVKAIIPVTALVAIIVNSLVNFPFHIGTTAMIAITWMGILQKRLNDA